MTGWEAIRLLGTVWTVTLYFKLIRCFCLNFVVVFSSLFPVFWSWEKFWVNLSLCHHQRDYSPPLVLLLTTPPFLQQPWILKCCSLQHGTKFLLSDLWLQYSVTVGFTLHTYFFLGGPASLWNCHLLKLTPASSVQCPRLESIPRTPAATTPPPT